MQSDLKVQYNTSNGLIDIFWVFMEDLGLWAFLKGKAQTEEHCLASD